MHAYIIPSDDDDNINVISAALHSGIPEYEDDNISGDEDDNINPGFYKVPADQRKANPDAYTPFLFSFGPYHDPDKAALPLANSALADGAYLKQKTAEGLLSSEQRERLVLLIADRKAQILTQYVERLVVDTSDVGRLALLLAVDAITIVAAPFSRDLQKHKLTPLIYHVARLVPSDAMLLENQIPVFLLELALQAILREGEAAAMIISKSLRLKDIIKWYCVRSHLFSDWKFQYSLGTLEETAKGEPLLSFLYNHVYALLVPDSGLEEADHGISPSPPPASRLARSGVQFQVSDAHNQKSILFFDSQNSILFLPQITVSKNGLRLIHNLLAYEATARFPKQYAFVSYVHLMDCLIDTAEDVHILTEAGIINNKLGSHEELASMWNKLCIYVVCLNTKSHHRIMVELDALSKQRWKKLRASFREKYWEKQPWLLFSILAAVILLILSFLQTIFTIMHA